MRAAAAALTRVALCCSGHKLAAQLPQVRCSHPCTAIAQTAHRAEGSAAQHDAPAGGVGAEADVGRRQLRLPLGAAGQQPLQGHCDGWLQVRHAHCKVALRPQRASTLAPTLLGHAQAGAGTHVHVLMPQVHATGYQHCPDAPLLQQPCGCPRRRCSRRRSRCPLRLRQRLCHRCDMLRTSASLRRPGNTPLHTREANAVSMQATRFQFSRLSCAPAVIAIACGVIKRSPYLGLRLEG
jgi:hypothetical protein